MRNSLFCWLALALGAQGLLAATADERAFGAAAKSFQLGIWDHAESEFAQFVEKFPQSAHVAEAVLLQAEAQYCQATNHFARQQWEPARQKLTQAVELLTARAAGAGLLADQYLYWRGEAHFQNTNYTAAAEAFATLAASFPNSARRLEASVRAAAARSKLGEWERVVELLQKADGPFQQAAKASPENEFVARGLLLVAEAQLALKHYPEAEAAVQPLAPSKLKPELVWQRKHLICRAQLGAGRVEEAKAGSAELLTIAEGTARGDLLAESVAFRAAICEQLGQLDEARTIYRRNLGTNSAASPERQRQALLKIAGLSQAQNELAEAGETLKTYREQFPGSTNAPLALLTIGELHLKQHVAQTKTNPAVLSGDHLHQALTNLDWLIALFPADPLVGKAHLGRGWCFWLSNNAAASVEAFRAAAGLLPPSEDQVVARFKWADGLFARRDFSGALTNYQIALDAAALWPRAKEELTGKILYQIVRAGLGATNLSVAADAMKLILQSYPGSEMGERSVLLVGQGYADAAKPEEGRALFEDFIRQYPEFELRPETELVIAHTFEQVPDWKSAIARYDAWLERFATNRLRPEVEFRRALANFHAGNETNTLMQLTNFVAQFPTNELAPLAQWWAAVYYFDQGDFLSAEINYKTVFQNWPGSELANQARMMAGRAAIRRSAPQDAIGYFTMLTGDKNLLTGEKNSQSNLWVEAMFAYGGALMLRNAGGTNDPAADLKLAIGVFGTIRERYPGSEHAAQAWGEIGKCYFQIGAQDSGSLVLASNAYQQVLSLPSATVAARSQAEIGIALVAEAQARQATDADKSALLKLARDCYLRVYENNVHEGESVDLFWIKEAGLGAAHILELLGEPEPARKIKEDVKLRLLSPAANANRK